MTRNVVPTPSAATLPGGRVAALERYLRHHTTVSPPLGKAVAVFVATASRTAAPAALHSALVTVRTALHAVDARALSARDEYKGTYLADRALSPTDRVNLQTYLHRAGVHPEIHGRIMDVMRSVEDYLAARSRIVARLGDLDRALPQGLIQAQTGEA